MSGFSNIIPTILQKVTNPPSPTHSVSYFKQAAKKVINKMGIYSVQLKFCLAEGMGVKKKTNL